MILSEGEVIRPLRDNILLEPLDWEASSILITIRSGRPVRGRVAAVGPGARVMKRWKNEQGQQCKIGETKHFVPCEVRVGDVVELGGLNVFDGKGYMFPEINVGSKRYIMITEKDVAGVVEQ